MGGVAYRNERHRPLIRVDSLAVGLLCCTTGLVHAPFASRSRPSPSYRGGDSRVPFTYPSLPQGPQVLSVHHMSPFHKDFLPSRSPAHASLHNPHHHHQQQQQQQHQQQHCHRPLVVSQSRVAMARGGPRSALPSGLAAVLAALTALALLAETSALTCDTDVQFKSSGGGLLGGLSSSPLSSVKGDSLCDNVNRDKFAKGSQVTATIAWGSKSRIISFGNPTCSAIAFHSARDCAGGPYVTYLRPPSIPDDTKW
ncbi:unnamed protein product [Closterium sp. Yama58-4]|nr:unnamed protein product [Closterium sp. Yama58-4]CAI5484594.1 unnamed protein product [Closterium sp. Yama58-4]